MTVQTSKINNYNYLVTPTFMSGIDGKMLLNNRFNGFYYGGGQLELLIYLIVFFILITVYGKPSTGASDKVITVYKRTAIWYSSVFNPLC